MKVNVLDEYCKGCGFCIHYCPQKILEFGKVRNSYGAFTPVLTNPDACVRCGICATVCPDAAIELREEKE